MEFNMNNQTHNREELKPILTGFIKHYISKRNVVDKKTLYHILKKVDNDQQLPIIFQSHLASFLKRERFHKGMTNEEVIQFWSPVFDKPEIRWEDRPKNVLEELFDD